MALTPYTDDMETWVKEMGMAPTAHFLPTLRVRVKTYQWVCESLFKGNTTPCLDWNRCLNKSSSYIEVVKVLHVMAHKHANPVPPEKLGYYIRTKWEPIGENTNELMRFATPFSKGTKVDAFAKDIKAIVDNMRKEVCEGFVNPLTPWIVSNKVLNALDQIRQLYDEFLQMQEEIELPTNVGHISILKTLELMTPGAIAANLQAMIECVRKYMSMGYMEQYFVDAAETPNLSQGLRCSKAYASIPLSVRNHCGGISKQRNGRYQGVSFANKKDASMGFRARTTGGSTIYVFNDEKVAATVTALSRKYDHTPKSCMNFMAYILADGHTMLTPYQRKLLVTLNVIAIIIHLGSAIFGFVLVGKGDYTRTTIVQDSVTYYEDKNKAPLELLNTCDARETDNGGAVIYETDCTTNGKWDGLLALSLAKLWTSCVHVYFLIEILTKWPAIKWWEQQSHYARWIEYSVSATLLTISQTSGIGISRNIYSLVLIALAFPVVLLAGGASEKLHGMLLRRMFKSSESEYEAKFLKWVLFFCGWLIQGAVFVVVGLAIGASDGSNSESEQSLWSMTASIYYVHYFSFPLVFVLWFTGKVFRDFIEVESVFILLSVSSKLALFWAITAVLFYIRYSTTAWEVVLYIALTFPLALTLFGPFIVVWLLRRNTPKTQTSSAANSELEMFLKK